jgi:hypothetical protein
MALALFALIIFQIGSHFYAQINLDHDAPIYSSHIAGITYMHHWAQLFIGWDEVSSYLWDRRAPGNFHYDRLVIMVGKKEKQDGSE